VNLEYNSDYQKTIERSYPDELNYKFKNLSDNMNLQKVYFLNNRGTASASELVITGLDPYMDVVQIGDSTYGKFYGAYVLPDDEKNGPYCLSS
jgi:C-terminal processing protease CtpA/Prc